jgi:hypothetical protein
MSRHSRSFTSTALLAALVSIPAMVHAQTSVAEKSLMNRVSPDLPRQVGEHYPISTRESGDQSLASRALLGTVGAIQLTEWDIGVAHSGDPTPEQALLGQPARSKTRDEN